jgi:hypothetical protein
MSEQNTDEKTGVEDEDEDDFYNEYESFLSEASTKRSVSTENVDQLKSSIISQENLQGSSNNLTDKSKEVSTDAFLADIDKFLEEDDEEVQLKPFNVITLAQIK